MFSGQKIGGFTLDKYRREQKIIDDNKLYLRDKYIDKLPEKCEEIKDKLVNSNLHCIKCCKTCKNKTEFGKIYYTGLYSNIHTRTGCSKLAIPVNEMWCCECWECDDSYSTDDVTNVNVEFVVEILDREEKDKK